MPITVLTIVDCINVKNVDALKEIKSLRLLFLRNLKIKDISSLQYLNNLKELNLEGTQVEDLSPLKKLNLRVLHIKNTPAAQKPIPEWWHGEIFEK